MTNSKPDQMVDDLLQLARSAPPEPSDAFLDQMRHLAVDHTPHMVADAQVSTRPRRGFAFWDWAPAGAAFACAAVLGVMLGLNPPQAALNVAGQFFETPDLWDISGNGGYEITLAEGS